jgi:ankyrin repeat protein
MPSTNGVLRLLVVVCSLEPNAFAQNSSINGIRNAMQRAVALLQSSQKNWNQDCFSCHHQALPSVALQAARRHGIAINEELAHVSAATGFAFLSNMDRAVQFTHLIDPGISESYILAGAQAAGVRPSLTTALYARMIAARQRADGHWDTLDVRPPQSYSPVTATANAVHAVRLYSHPSQANDVQARTERARKWLAAVSPRDTEERTMQILGLFWAGAGPSLIRPLAAALAAQQQPDGGWRSVVTRPSDAYSTGEVLVALHDATAVPVRDAAWQRGLLFLQRTQAPDGSWHVVTRVQPPAPVSPPYFETGYPYGHDQFISSMGASWAIRALADALGDDQPMPMPELREAQPEGVESWMEPMLFGSVADVRGLLDNGLDANWATKSGGTTALMMAMPDIEKAKLLIARGANINARAKTKYSALMVAAQYPGSSPVMRLLMDNGAAVQVPKGAGAPLFNASPLVLASAAGNSDILPRLMRAGARSDSPMLMLGSFPATAFQAAVFFGDTTAVRTLIENGAAVDLPDDDGITPLSWAAIGDLAPVAKLLIERGADVNHVDKKGMTPLLYSASVGFGDAVLVDLLLRSGANPNARTKQGFTAADLVRRYQHSHLYGSLNVDISR